MDVVRAERISILKLAVKGWFVTDGVRSFDRELHLWGEPLVDRAVLESIHVEPVEISAVWKVETADRSALEARLQEFFTARGLTHTLDNNVDPESILSETGQSENNAMPDSEEG